ncbi:MAG: bifunctional (p)ppGpp synthetase/guanosine-3',5'-bis(diphosphate) 3'-pyrophosphohydrolase, partial [Clostridia bacterium]|nr:bifunctional (p)ppGpp synthetase/guanosine-3',5'-bis(diphosphate) 3'-pyrophosphohydrolase [Clostridia bacterium]
DYICERNRKTNMYQSLHTTVFGPNERIVQTQIRTFEMDKTASFGLTAYWDIKKGEARYTMQKELTNRFQFFKSLTEINNIFTDNHDFVNQVKTELFTNNVYAYTTSGIIIELPLGSTIIDYVYKVDPDNAHNMVDAYVNDEQVSFDYEIKNKDRIKIVISDLSQGTICEEGVTKGG